MPRLSRTHMTNHVRRTRRLAAVRRSRRARPVARNTATGHIFKTKIEGLEALGSDSYPHFTVDSPRISSSERLAAASAIKQGQEAQLWVDTSQLQLFDHETGRSLLTRESSRLEVAESSTASRRRRIA
jgi:ABC-type sugar transport system ATPase subunit